MRLAPHNTRDSFLPAEFVVRGFFFVYELNERTSCQNKSSLVWLVWWWESRSA